MHKRKCTFEDDGCQCKMPKSDTAEGQSDTSSQSVIGTTTQLKASSEHASCSQDQSVGSTLPCRSPVSLEVQPFDWKTSPLDGSIEDQLTIRCWCKDVNNKIKLLLFPGFACTAYLELPERGMDGRAIGWNMQQITSLKAYLREDVRFDDCRAGGMSFVRKRKLYYADTTPVKFVRLRFPNESILKKFCKVARMDACLAHIGQVRFNVHEDNVKVLSKFLARVKTKCTQWMRVTCTPVPESERISRDGIGEYEADFDSIEGMDRETVLPYKVLSFDIEVFSSVENRFPTALNSNDAVFSISVVTETFNQTVGGDEAGKRSRWCLCIGDNRVVTSDEAGDTDNTSLHYVVVQCKDERHLIYTFSELVVREDPDVITGHNIWGFDMKYLYMRANLVLKCRFPDMGRTKVVSKTELTTTENIPIYKKRADNMEFVTRHLEEVMKDDDIEDSDYVYPHEVSGSKKVDPLNRHLTVVDGKLQLSKQEIRDEKLETLYSKAPVKSCGKRQNVYTRNKIHCFRIEGRVALDTLPASKERRLDTYTLQNVCSTLMGKSKLDMSSINIFRSFRMAVLKSPTDADVIDAMASNGMEDVDDAMAEDAVDKFSKDLYSRVNYYCVKDSDLVMDLFDHMNVWPAMMEYSSCFGVTPYESLACGQQARCLSIVYCLASNKGYVLNHPSSLSQGAEPFVGGRVVEPIPGIYDYVMCFDFTSLYPSIIQECNICHTTFIPRDRWSEFGEGEYISIREAQDEGDSELRFSSRKRGIIPELCQYLVRERRAAKCRMADADKGSSLQIAMDCRQKALKITANSMYGLMGAEVGALRLVEGSRSITCRGRQLQRDLAESLRSHFDTVEIYGDTDSSMVTGRGNLKCLLGKSAEGGVVISSPAQAFSMGKEMEDYLNGSGSEQGVFKSPIKVEMEKVMKMLVVHKKMYAYLQYAEPVKLREEQGDGEVRETVEDLQFDRDAFEKDANGIPMLVSKGLLSARRNTCRICKSTFESVVNLILSNCSPTDLLLGVAKLLRKFLLSGELDNFIKTVEIAGRYESSSCANSVFKKNMLRMGTKIEPRSRVAYVLVVTPNEKSGNTVSIGSKMLLTKYYNQEEHRIDNLQYLESGLKKSLDQVVSIAAQQFSHPIHIAGRGAISLNHPVSSVIKLVAAKNARWCMSGVDTYEFMVKKEADRLGETYSTC